LFPDSLKLPKAELKLFKFWELRLIGLSILGATLNACMVPPKLTSEPETDNPDASPNLDLRA
jgi:hypothetical protein